jgi:hypothetical protein
MKKRAIIQILVSVLTLTGYGAMGQGGLTPLVNSTHTYSVTPGSVANTLAWTVTGGVPADYVINSGAATATVNITWKTAGSYFLEFRETSPTSCITVVKNSVVVGVNSFDVSIPSVFAATCNAASGVPNAPANPVTTISFTVSMASGNVAWNPNWEFSFTLTPSAGVTINNVVASSGTLSGTGPYTVTGATSAAGVGSVTITLDVTGDATTVHTVAYAITSAKELQYQTIEANAANNNATQTINAIPATTGFSAN